VSTPAAAGEGRSPAPERIGEHHRNVQGGAARAAVFGINDGLVSNVALILGVAGASPAPGIVRLAGLAGLVGGAFSMAAGEYVSMRAHSELLARELEVERAEIARRPESERRELAYIYRSRGMPPGLADRLATELMRDPDVALETHAREELGIDPEELGKPLHAAASSFAAFSLGALIPLLPWFFTGGSTAVLASLALAALAAAAVGIALAAFTGRWWVRSVGRQVLIAGVAAGITYAIGTLVGATSIS
jgi:VIT1/CCC1 family predicted Fe2+/Mn2+ transporter